MKVKLSFVEVDIIAEEWIGRLAPHCQRIEKAGSLLRRKPQVGDVDLVIIPQFLTNMFGDKTNDHKLNTIDWSAYGDVIKNGPKYKQIILPSGVSLELSIVTPPAQFGVLFMIRTGPEDFSNQMVTPRQKRTHKGLPGLMPSCYHFKDGAIWCNNHIIPTPEERDVFDLFGMQYVQPWERV